MPDPDRLLHTLAVATRAFAETPGRRGRLVIPQDADEILVAGDLHGNIENFRRILQRGELASHPRRHLVLQEVVHGSLRYANGGDKSHQLIDLIAALKCQYPTRVHFLLGNHELAQWAGHFISKLDFEQTTLFRMGVNAAYGPRAPEIYAAYMELLGRASLAVRTPNRIFISHSLPWLSEVDTFDISLLETETPPVSEWHYGGRLHALVWGRDVSSDTVSAFLSKIDADYLITGHIPCEAGYATPNDRQLILDSAGEPAAYCLFPVDRGLNLAQLVTCVQVF
jgi:hypothetical protein